MTIFEKLDAVKTMPELDALRPEVAELLSGANSKEAFEKIQQAFIKKRNKLLRIPLKERSW